MTGLFADRARRVVLPLLVLLLGADLTAWMVVDPHAWDDHERCMVSEPDAHTAPPCLGETITLPLQVVTAIEGPERYQVGRARGRMPVVGSTEALSVGDEITLVGVRTEAGLVPELVEAHPLRWTKRVLGLVGAVVLAGLLLLAFTLRRTDAGWRVVRRG